MNEAIDIRKIKKSTDGNCPKEETSIIKGNDGFWDILNKDISLFGSSLPDKVKEAFYEELGILLEAGVDIRSALELIKNEQQKKRYRKVFDGVNIQVITGFKLSESLKNSNCFTTYEYYSVQIGEETGKLKLVLKELADYFEKKIRQKRLIIGALIYPTLVLVVAFGAVSFMLTYVVPMFADVLKRFGGELPLITRLVLRFSAFMKEYMGMLLLFIIGLAVLIFTQKKQSWFRNLSSAILLKIPLIGEIIRKIYISRFAKTMALLIGSKIPLIQSIQLVKMMIGFYPIEASLSGIEMDILSGMPFHKSLSGYPIYPPKIIALIKVGEEVNQLELFFNKISEQYSNEVEYQSNLLSKFLEPLIIVILGAIVGVILIAMYLPLFKLGQSF